jgi:hypothetical protein
MASAPSTTTALAEHFRQSMNNAGNSSPRRSLLSLTSQFQGSLPAQPPVQRLSTLSLGDTAVYPPDLAARMLMDSPRHSDDGDTDIDTNPDTHTSEHNSESRPHTSEAAIALPMPTATVQAPQPAMYERETIYHPFVLQGSEEPGAIRVGEADENGARRRKGPLQCVGRSAFSVAIAEDDEEAQAILGRRELPASRRPLPEEGMEEEGQLYRSTAHRHRFRKPNRLTAERAAYFSVKMERPMHGGSAHANGRRCVGLWGLRGEGDPEDEVYRQALVHQPTHARAGQEPPLALVGEVPRALVGLQTAPPSLSDDASCSTTGAAAGGTQLVFNERSGVSITRGDGVGYEYTYFDGSDDASESSASRLSLSVSKRKRRAARGASDDKGTTSGGEVPAVAWNLRTEAIVHRDSRDALQETSAKRLKRLGKRGPEFSVLGRGYEEPANTADEEEEEGALVLEPGLPPDMPPMGRESKKRVSPHETSTHTQSEVGW